MAKSKDKKKLVLPKAESLASAKTLVEAVADRKVKLAKAKEGATKDGKLVRTEPKYRLALKRSKRAQRALRKELIRVRQRGEAKPAEAAAAAAPAEEKKE